MAGRLTVAVDIDEVLGAFVEALALWHNEHHGSALTVADFHSYHFSDVWGGTTEESIAKVHAFFESTHFASLRPIQEAADVLRAHAKAFRYVVVTSRQHILEARTRAWLAAHFPGVFEDVVFGNHYGATGHKTTKADMCAAIDAAVLIDDSVAYATECAAVVPSVLLFGEYSWNAVPEGSKPLPSNVHRVINWRHVGALLQRLRPAHAQHAHQAGPPLAQGQGQGQGQGSGWRQRGGQGGGYGGGGPAGGWAGGDDAGVGTALTSRGTRVPVLPPTETLVLTSRHPNSFHAEAVRRVLEYRASVTLTASGEECHLAAETADILTRADDATVSSIRTGADDAGPSGVRTPRLTIGLTRAPRFLAHRCDAGHDVGAVAVFGAGGDARAQRGEARVAAAGSGGEGGAGRGRGGGGQQGRERPAAPHVDADAGRAGTGDVLAVGGAKRQMHASTSGAGAGTAPAAIVSPRPATPPPQPPGAIVVERAADLSSDAVPSVAELAATREEVARALSSPGAAGAAP